MIERRSGHALVLGLGASGLAAARLMRRQGWHVTALDEKAVPDARTAASGVSQVSRELDRTVIERTDFAVVSPGIPAGHAWLNALVAANVPVIPEFEFGLASLPEVRVIAVTGSNGKSSVVKWMADTLPRAGHTAIPAGNYGTPVSEVALAEVHPEILVLEVSSFQLEQSVRFSPEIGILLNLAPNHLDRHATMNNYIKAKARIFACPAADGLTLVHGPAWPLVRNHGPVGWRPKIFDQAVSADYGADRGHVFSAESGMRVDLTGTWWGRMPLLVNAAAALAVFERFGVSADLIRESSVRFEPLPHRLERVGEKDGVAFINDSKCSTLTALAAALSSGRQKYHLIAGGILKEDDLGFLKELLAEKCAFVYFIGNAAQRLLEAWRDVVPCENCGDLSTAFARAVANAAEGETVLLSPGCSSFDQFTGYAQRGNAFKDLARAHLEGRRK